MFARCCCLRLNYKRFPKLFGILFISFLLCFFLDLFLFRENDSDKSLTTKSAIDMVNDYRPFVDFKFVVPETAPIFFGSQNFFMVVLVNSGAKGEKYRERRQNIRETWGNKKNCEAMRVMNNPKSKNLKWLLVFLVGKAGPMTNDDSLNAEEAGRNSGLLIGDIEDNYINNIVKLYMGQLWVSTLNARPKYILKTDDDVYVRIPLVLEYLTNENFPGRFYGGSIGRGHRVRRRVEDKWSISRKYFDEDVFPPYHFGAFFILSTDLLPSLLKYVHTRKPFHTDDAYIGIAMRDLKVKVTHISSFHTEFNMPARIPGFSDCQILFRAAFGHNITPKLSRMLHHKLEFLCNKNITLKQRCWTILMSLFNW